MKTTQVKERPVIFSAEDVRAILDGRKTQFRRVVKPQPEFGAMVCPYCPSGFGERDSPDPDNYGCRCTRGKILKSPFGRPGDRLWVKETWRWCHGWLAGRGRSKQLAAEIRYKADNHAEFRQCPFETKSIFGSRDMKKWKSPVSMPRWASRFTLVITDVRVERLQEITLSECTSEGVPPTHDAEDVWDSTKTFQRYWNSRKTNRGYEWDTNPWVWVYKFVKETT